MNYCVDLNALLKNKVKKEVTSLFVNFFYILEDIKQDGRMSDEEYNRLRKRVLDYGNNAVRNISEDVDNLEVKFKQ